MAGQGPTEQDMAMARMARRTAVVLAGTGVIWALVQMIGQEYGWSGRLMGLFDLMAIGAFVWTLAQTYQIWRKRQAS